MLFNLTDQEPERSEGGGEAPQAIAASPPLGESHWAQPVEDQPLECRSATGWCALEFDLDSETWDRVRDVLVVLADRRVEHENDVCNALTFSQSMSNDTAKATIRRMQRAGLLERASRHGFTLTKPGLQVALEQLGELPPALGARERRAQIQATNSRQRHEPVLDAFVVDVRTGTF